MAKTAILAVKIISDAKDAAKGFDTLSGKTSKLAGGLKLLGGAAITGITAFGAAVVKGVASAGDLEQSVGAIDAVFKTNATQMHQWATTAATDFGLTRNEFNELGTVLGTQLKNGGTAMDQLAPKTKALIGLGSDLSAMFGGTTADAVGALSSALKGERDPIERYGVSLNQASIDAKAAELGFKKVGGALTTEANQAATLALIMDQTRDAQGAWARETNTLAHQKQVFAAKLENASAALGQLFLPAATAAFTFLADTAVPAVQGLINWLAPLGDGIKRAFEGLGTSVGGATAPLDTLRAIATSVGNAITTHILPAFQRFGGAVQGWAAKIQPIITQISTFVLGKFQEWSPRIQGIFTTITEIISGALDLITAIITPVIDYLTVMWETWGGTIMAYLGGVWNNVVTIIETALGVIKGIIKTVTSLIKGDWQGAWDGIKTIFTSIWDGIKNLITNNINTIHAVLTQAWDAIKTITSSAWANIKTVITNAWNGIKTTVTNAINGVRSTIANVLSTIQSTASSAWNGIKSAAANAWNGIKSAVSGAWNAIRSAITGGVNNAVSVVRGLPGQIYSALSGMAGRLTSIGSDMIRGLIDGVRNMAGRLVSEARNVVSNAWNAAKNFLGIRSPSKLFETMGNQTVQGLIIGLNDMQRPAERAAERIARAVAAPRIELDTPTLNTRLANTRTNRTPVINITVNGALDPTAVARQIRDMLRALDRHTGVAA